MHSVIIQNKKTTDLFCQFNPLFMNAVNSGRVSICKWYEAGTTIETAIPELYDAIGDEEAWRAIVVHAVDDEEMSRFPASPLNPFDFSANFTDADREYGESRVPLVRLSQLLGGVPRPDIAFTKRLISTPGHPVRTAYDPQYHQQDEERYQALLEKYCLNAPAPSEIFFIGIRKGYSKEGFKHSLMRSGGNLTVDEDFVARNRYPAGCRFVMYDMNKKGSAGYINDCFNFWASVLLLALNGRDCGSLQAYKIYKVSVDIDKVQLEKELTSAARDAISAKNYIDAQIAIGMNDLEDDSNNVAAPYYQLAVEVPIGNEPLSSPVPEALPLDMYGQATASRNIDIGGWDRAYREIQGNFKLVERTNERILDRTAMRIHGKCEYSEASVRPLNEYQLEALYEELDKDRDEISRLSAALPSGASPLAEEMERKSIEAKTELMVRASGRQVTWGLITEILLILLCMLPAFVLDYRLAELNKVTILSVALVSVCAVGLTTFAILAVQHGRLKKIIAAFNALVQKRLSEMLDDSKLYSRYLSKIASHMHGSSYLNTILRRQKKLVSEFAGLLKHKRDIESFLDTLHVWAKAHYLNYRTPVNVNTAIGFDTSIPASQNELFSLNTPSYEYIGVNGPGESIVTPLAFISKLNLTQEEVYYDKRDSQ